MHSTHFFDGYIDIGNKLRGEKTVRFTILWKILIGHTHTHTHVHKERKNTHTHTHTPPN